MRFVLVDSTSQLTYISPILEVYKFLFALSALRQRSLANRDSHLFIFGCAESSLVHTGFL